MDPHNPPPVTPTALLNVPLEGDETDPQAGAGKAVDAVLDEMHATQLRHFDAMQAGIKHAGTPGAHPTVILPSPR